MKVSSKIRRAQNYLKDEREIMELICYQQGVDTTESTKHNVSFFFFHPLGCCSLSRQLAFPVMFGNFQSATGLLIFVMMREGLGGCGWVGLIPGDSVTKSLDKVRKASPLAFFGKAPRWKNLYLRNGDNWKKKKKIVFW